MRTLLAILFVIGMTSRAAQAYDSQGTNTSGAVSCGCPLQEESIVDDEGRNVTIQLTQGCRMSSVLNNFSCSWNPVTNQANECVAQVTDTDTFEFIREVREPCAPGDAIGVNFAGRFEQTSSGVMFVPFAGAGDGGEGAQTFNQNFFGDSFDDGSTGPAGVHILLPNDSANDVDDSF